MGHRFTPVDRCCQSVLITDSVRVGHSQRLNGPSVDRDGVDMTRGGGSMVLEAHDRWRGPGHNGFLVADGITRMVYRACDARQVGMSKQRIESVL